MRPGFAHIVKTNNAFCELTVFQKTEIKTKMKENIQI